MTSIALWQKRLTEKGCGAPRNSASGGVFFEHQYPDWTRAKKEGTFLLGTFWLAHTQALAGEIERARATFERAIGYANDIGLLAEEVDAETGELLGNFPQAFSHIGLVNAAWAIAQGT